MSITTDLSTRWAEIRDDFAGPGGWDEGLRILGVDPSRVVGVEWDRDACATAAAAGHHRVQGDVRKAQVIAKRGYISSPPCQPFTAAGKGAGRAALSDLLHAVALVADGASPEEATAHCEGLDYRSVLVLHPLTVVRDHRPEWVALEQVPAVLPVWEAYAEHLRAWGYSVATGVLSSEQYGVPQTRRRAVLVASRVRTVALPAPTHSKYYARDRFRRDAGVLPWVSMAAALDEHQHRTTGEPACWQPVAAVEGNTQWVEQRPSPTIVGTFAADVVAAPGYRKAGDPPRQKTPGSVRVTQAQAGVLQSFPADYPWQGSKTSQQQQVGNAVPPLMAAAILAAVM